MQLEEKLKYVGKYYPRKCCKCGNYLPDGSNATYCDADKKYTRKKKEYAQSKKGKRRK